MEITVPIFQEYNSSLFPTIEDSILHSKTNPFIVSNFSTDIIFSDSGNVIPSPITNINQLIKNLNDLLVNYNVSEEEFYRPETTSIKLYGSPDFWYLILLLNNIGTVLDYTKNTIKVLPEKDLFKIEQLFKVVKQIKVKNENIIFK
jgi:hypothetical protein